MSNLSLCLAKPSSGQNPNEPIIVHSRLPATVPANHIVIRVDRFGFSANNVTYQALGEHPHFRYFDFHTCPTASEKNAHVSPETHGLVPVWGFGTIIVSSQPTLLPVGERVYGYMAPCKYLVVPISKADLNRFSFYVPRPHLPVDRRPYNQFLRCATDTQYTPTGEGEDLTMIYRPLFWTAYWCEDWLALSDFHGAEAIIISSASSKTAFCLAYCINQRIVSSTDKKGLPTRIIGLTSKKNVEFTKYLGLYTHVYSYDADWTIPELSKGAFVYVDVSGMESLNKRVLSHFSKNAERSLKLAVSLGFTSLPAGKEASTIEWNGMDGKSQFTQFFMVEWLQQRKHQLTLQEIFARQQKAWDGLMRDCKSWVKVERVYGAEKVKEAYGKIISGRIGPDTAYVWSLWEENETSRTAKL